MEGDEERYLSICDETSAISSVSFQGVRWVGRDLPTHPRRRSTKRVRASVFGSVAAHVRSSPERGTRRGSEGARQRRSALITDSMSLAASPGGGSFSWCRRRKAQLAQGEEQFLFLNKAVNLGRAVKKPDTMVASEHLRSAPLSPTAPVLVLVWSSRPAQELQS